MWYVMRQEHQNENGSRRRRGQAKGSIVLAGTDASSGLRTSERASGRRMSRKKMPCANGRTHFLESEWSLMISLSESPSAGRSFFKKCVARTHFAWTTCCSNQKKKQMKPRFVKPRVFRGMEKAPCLFTFHDRWEPGGLTNPQTSAQLSGMDPGPHSGGRPGGVGKILSSGIDDADMKRQHRKVFLPAYWRAPKYGTWKNTF